MEKGKFKVLMIDDEETIIGFFQKTFENFKHIHFLTALRADEGIALAAAEKPEVVLLDLRMPGMNGEEALDELAAMLPDSRFVIMSGWDDGTTQERLESHPRVSAFFPKPVDLEKVITKVMSLMMLKE